MRYTSLLGAYKAKEEAITSFFTQSSINLDYAALHGEVYHRVTK